MAYAMLPNKQAFNLANPNPPTPGRQNAVDAYQAAQTSNMVSDKFHLPLQQDAGMWANILPAAIQIEEHKKMNEVAMQYQKEYVEKFQKRYGFSEPQIQKLKDEFAEITTHITDLIPDDDLKKMYTKYVQAYPNMFLSMIPAEALQSKLAVKYYEDNRALRTEITEMSKCVSHLVKSLSSLQMKAGIPAIVNLMFESMPDPLTAITDPMYSSYNDAIETYHALLNDTGNVNPVNSKGQSATSSVLISDNLPKDPLATLRGVLRNNNSSVSDDKVQQLTTVIENMNTQSGCQTYGNEWNHTGPEPAMNPAMCLADDTKMQPGNPRNAQGRTAVYQAQRTQDGGARWVMKGQVPNVGGTQAPQAVHHAQMAHGSPQYQQMAGWQDQYQMPVRKNVKKTKKTKKSRKSSK